MGGDHAEDCGRHPVYACGARHASLVGSQDRGRLRATYYLNTTSLAALKQYSAANIVLLKEEGDSSHVNQSYDREPALELAETAARDLP